jgi:hypothetical protein
MRLILKKVSRHDTISSPLEAIFMKKEERIVFPTVCDQMKSLLPEAYFGGEEIPPYCHAAIDDLGSVEDIVSSIRSIAGGGNCCGYVDHEGIHFHLPDDDIIRVDLSRDFVFVSRPGEESGANMTAWQVLTFLEEPARRALFVGQAMAVYVEKSNETLTLCKVLDRIWNDEQFLPKVVENSDSDEGRDRLLAILMNAYEKKAFGEPSQMWWFWDTFRNYLMTRALHLTVVTLG